jgi:hypothetical protein
MPAAPAARKTNEDEVNPMSDRIINTSGAAIRS